MKQPHRFEQSQRGWIAPEGLDRARPRRVALTGGGKALLVLALALCIGSLPAAVLLGSVARRNAEERRLMQEQGRRDGRPDHSSCQGRRRGSLPGFIRIHREWANLRAEPQGLGSNLEIAQSWSEPARTISSIQPGDPQSRRMEQERHANVASASRRLLAGHGRLVVHVSYSKPAPASRRRQSDPRGRDAPFKGTAWLHDFLRILSDERSPAHWRNRSQEGSSCFGQHPPGTL